MLGAFTLAEVLVTLGVIGVVAALTLPSVITNYQKKQTVVQLKKLYSTLSNASGLSQSENGEMREWDNSLINTDIKKYAETYYLPYFNRAKVVDWPSNDYTIKNLSGNQNLYSSGREKYVIELSNGQLLIFSQTQMGQHYLWIFGDINGTKGPNKIGRDIFVFDGTNFTKDSNTRYFVKFWGDSFSRSTLTSPDFEEDIPNNSGYSCNKKNKYGRYSGYYCGELIMQDNWEIRNDYPW